MSEENEQTKSFIAGTYAAKAGRNINNSHPFNHDEFVSGYKSIIPDAKTLFDQLDKPEDKIDMLKIIEMVKNG